MKIMSGDPDPKHVSASFVERQNLTMRMSMRRFTRLTNGFSRKWTITGTRLPLYFMYYNFCRVHQPEEIADLLAFIVSPAAKWMTGSSVRMDGGEIKGI